MKKILLVGYGEVGKDDGLIYLSGITGLCNGGTTSKYLAKYVAQKLGCDPVTAYASRRENREFWYQVGRELRESDPGALLRDALAVGPLVAGVRDFEEIIAARRFNLVDLIVWIENITKPVDPTVKFGPEHCDVIIQNNASLDEYHEKLRRLAAFAGLV